jgi:hypothetical protein
VGFRLSEWRIGHAETGADVFGKKFDGAPIGDWVGLRQISPGIDQ